MGKRRGKKIPDQYDIPVTFYCRECKNTIEKSLSDVERHPLNLFCRACPQEFTATEDEITKARDRHRQRFDATVDVLRR